MELYSVLNSSALQKIAEFYAASHSQEDFATLVVGHVEGTGAVLSVDPALGLATYINALSIVSSNKAAASDRIRHALLRVATGSGNVNGDEARPFVLDEFWAWLRCWVAHAAGVDTFVSGLAESDLRPALSRSPFLLCELARATVLSNAPDLTTLFLPHALERCIDKSKVDPAGARAFGVVCARLAYAAAGKGITSPAAMALTDASYCVGPEAVSAFLQEADRCAEVDAAHATRPILTPRDLSEAERFATSVSMAELRDRAQRRAARADEGLPNLESVLQEPLRGRYVRMEQEVVGALSQTASNVLLSAISALSSDPDAVVRCVGVAQALRDDYRPLMSAASENASKSVLHDLREWRRDCARTALAQPNHHWIAGSIVAAYHQFSDGDGGGQNSPKIMPEKGWGLPALSTLGLTPWIKAADSGSNPALSFQLQRVRKTTKRIALVLPSITPGVGTTPEAEGSLSNKGSPPLGLGQIATYLSARGHFVSIYDAHRYLYDENALATELASYDMVGISVVISTIESSASIINRIRGVSSATSEPCKIVVGGHAPTLLTPDRLRAAGVDFDYLVIGPGEEAFEAILHDGQSGEGPKVVVGSDLSKADDPANSLNKSGIARERTNSSTRYQDLLNQLPWTDRELFIGPKGDVYEPCATRNQTDIEAHIVVSRGCEWRCVFCTEALIAGRFGENRRSVNDVLGEIGFLSRRYGASRVQFIDDNVFPTQPAYKRQVSGRSLEGMGWVRDFFSGLDGNASGELELKVRPAMRWRGLMRTEDFLFYEKVFPGFIDDLSRSGCNLLAFGIESGTEKTRERMKGRDELRVDNATIVDMIARLRSAGIFVKGYFILGGPGQTKADAHDTIDFAVRSGLDLAYFAIYKEFREITSSAKSSPSDEQASLKFNLFSTAIFATASRPEDVHGWQALFGSWSSQQERERYAETFRELAGIGFSFDDLIRYNDYHEWNDPYARMGFADHTEYLQCLATAYLRFYGRPEWVGRYRALVTSGY